MFHAQQQIERRIRRKTRRIPRIVFLLFANYCLNLQSKKSIEGARRQQVGSSNHITPSGPTSWIVQSDRSDRLRTNKSDRPIRLLWQDQQVVRTNQSSSTDLLSVLTNQSSPTDLLSVSFNQIAQTDLLSVSINQSSSTDLLSVSTNQSSSTDLLSISTNQSSSKDLLSVSSNQIARTDILSVRANEIDRSVTGRNHQEIKSLAWSQTARVDERQ